MFPAGDIKGERAGILCAQSAREREGVRTCGSTWVCYRIGLKLGSYPRTCYWLLINIQICPLKFFVLYSSQLNSSVQDKK